MDTKNTAATKPTGFTKTDAPRAFSEMAEKGATQAKGAYEKMGAATTEAADLFKTSCASGLKGAQDYNNKFMEFAQANTNAAFDFVQKLHDVKSPSEFIELSTHHARTQTETLIDQTKRLAELAQKIALAAAEPLNVGAAKAFHRAG
jgi:phasin